jgi:hypothetical protein
MSVPCVGCRDARGDVGAEDGAGENTPRRSGSGEFAAMDGLWTEDGGRLMACKNIVSLEIKFRKRDIEH